MITYGKGEVFGIEDIQAFDIVYKGKIEITPNQNDWILNANSNRILGISLNQTSNLLLFTYIGEFKILYAKYVKNNELIYSDVTVQGVDYWELDDEKWEDDTSLWGSRGGTYSFGVAPIRTIVKNLENGITKVPETSQVKQTTITPPTRSGGGGY
tara:strand:- start:2631 stop:3095 length:465 start_codon:yes stop_codon:yes gene_type:complete